MFGRLKNKMGQNVAAKSTNEVCLVEDGPMVFTGHFVVTGANGADIHFSAQELDAGVAICRCGRSKNTPMCDGSHKTKQ